MGRTRGLDGAGRKPPQYVRERYTYKKKFAVIQFHAEFGLQPTMARFFPGLCGKVKLNKSRTVLKWVATKEYIKSMATAAKTKDQLNARAKGLGCTLPAAAEDQLRRWVQELRDDGIPVSRLMLREKALLVAEDCASSCDAMLPSAASSPSSHLHGPLS